MEKMYPRDFIEKLGLNSREIVMLIDALRINMSAKKTMLPEQAATNVWHTQFLVEDMLDAIRHEPRKLRQRKGAWGT